ncbi:MAG: hypothetical protein EOP08_14455, partial [Proteobacteria bacterium]
MVGMRANCFGGLLLVSSLVACGETAPQAPGAPAGQAPVSEPGATDPSNSEAALRALILGIDAPVVPAAQPVRASAAGNATENHDSQLVSCTYERHQGVDVYDT